MNTGLDTTVDEITRGVYRFSTWIPDITDRGFTFNQFLLTGEEPFLFHCGQRFLFDQVSAAIARSSRWRPCAGSPSGTSKPTSAAR